MIIFKKNKILIICIIVLFAICLSKYKSEKNIFLQTSATTSKYKILVDVEESRLYLFQDNEVVKTYKCSGGKYSTPSPIGTWTIISKAKWGEGFGRKLDGIKCTMGTIWNTWHIRKRFNSAGQVLMAV